MASSTQEEILKRFEEAGRQSTSGSSVARAEAAGGAGDGGISAAEPSGQNVEGGAKTETQNSGGTNTAETVMKDVFESGLGVVPLIGGLMGLFGGGSSSPPPLLKYQMPSSISFMSADTGDQLSAADYNEMGSPRVYDPAAYTDAAPAGDAGGTGSPSPGGVNTGEAGAAVAPGSAGSTQASPQITVNVQAMDAQSFLDRSSDIAQAVRSAMLNMSSINDVVSDL
jgi:hypothetical protein